MSEQDARQSRGPAHASEAPHPVSLRAVLIGLAISVVLYKYSAVGSLAYSLGFAAALLAATNARQSFVRAEQAELLLALPHP